MTTTQARTLGLGFIGLGQAVNLILRRKSEIESLPYRIVAAAERGDRISALATFEKEFGGKGYTSVEALCEDPDVDVIYVGTLPDQRLAHVELAAQAGKHIIVEKPMAGSVADGLRMVDIADAHSVKLLAGHTHSFDAPIRHMEDVIRSSELGSLLSILSFNYNDFSVRPWPNRELQASRGPVLNQGPHQVDIVRQLAGGLVKSVRASTIWDDLRDCEGGYNCHLLFEDGVSALLSFDARGLFDSGELFGWIGEGGQQKQPGGAVAMRENFVALKANSSSLDELDAQLEAQKEQGRYGASATSDEAMRLFGYTGGVPVHQPFFGYTLASCQRGVIRQSPDGIVVYGERGPTERPTQRTLNGRAAELMEMYDAITEDRPLFHDGRWGLATLEVCLGMLESAATGTEIPMTHQVASRGSDA
jgi:phthalate 4,5-cis-dihydrodiol dehydrogenase